MFIIFASMPGEKGGAVRKTKKDKSWGGTVLF